MSTHLQSAPQFKPLAPCANSRTPAEPDRQVSQLPENPAFGDTPQTRSLHTLVTKAAQQLASASSAAEVLEARDMAGVAYDASKKAARLARAKGAHDELIAKAHRAQADALEIEATAKRRLADEYDAAQERGEVVSSHGGAKKRVPEEIPIATVAEIGLTKKDIHEARQIRDAEANDPGVVQRTLEARLDAGQEPTKAALREAVVEAAMRGLKGMRTGGSNRNPLYRPPTPAGSAWTYLYGECRALVEWATPENLSLALAGRLERPDDHRQTSNRSAVARHCSPPSWRISMLSNKLHLFYEKLNEFVAVHGTYAALVTDDIISKAFPDTVSAAEQEGCIGMFRTGVHSFVSQCFKRTPAHHPQQTSLSIPEPFKHIVAKLNGEAHYVEKLKTYVPVPVLINKPKWLDDARKYKRRKGQETLDEARVLDELYDAVMAAKRRPAKANSSS